MARSKELLAELPRGRSATHPGELLARIFQVYGAPLLFDELVRMVAPIWGVEDSARSCELAAREIDTEQVDLAELLHLRRWTQEAWVQIRDLPRAQRVALLLNLRAEDSSPAIALLPITGIASIREIADVLGFAVSEFAAIWNELPWDDLTIAQRLNLTRQQVINLRKSARERLIRRMGGRYR